MKLTAKKIETLTKPGRYGDDSAPGLYLFVQAHRTKAGETTIRKSFVQRLTVRGKRVDIGLGTVRWGATTITEARRRAVENYRIARAGGDPRVRADARAMPTFAEGLDAVLAIQRGAWKHGGKNEAQWRASLRDYALPRLGAMRVDTVGPGDVLAVLAPIWNTRRETARKVRQRIAAIMQWAVAEGHRESNPADAIGKALPSNGTHKAHHRALPYLHVSGALAAVEASAAWWSTRAAFRFLVLTAARSGEVRGMQWSEVDMDSATWAVPGSRMKLGREHRVPLSGAALAVLREARERTGGDGLVFPAKRGGSMSDMTISKLVKERGIAAVPHGFRSSFRDWAAECTNIPREVAEHALAHVEGSASELAYRRTDYFERRRALMESWAAFLAAERGKVVKLRA